MLRITNIVMSLGICFIIASCSKTTADCGTSADCSTVTYEATIKPLIANKCGLSGCHGSEFSSYSGLKKIVDDGFLESEVVNSENMPTGGITMTCIERQEVECWINAGATNN